MKLFTNDREAVFIRRPNRFLIIAGDQGEEIPCHCPNPGRLIEFFGPRGYDIPGAKLILEKRQAEGPTKAKTGWTAAGLYYRDTVVPLFSARANQAAETLILPGLIPGLREIRPEFSIGGSRFDFLCIGRGGVRHLIEVKACSLIEYGTAMFPDAPSERALKHLEELAALSNEGYRCHVLFVIVHGKPKSFIPNLHADPALAAALSRLGHPAKQAGKKGGQRRAGVEVHAALFHCDAAGDTLLAEAEVPVDLSHGALAGSNSGSYLILLELAKETELAVGSLGTLTFPPGWYVYAGSARKNLAQRVNRHLRKVRKQRHWHIDSLTPAAKTIKALPVFSYRNLECDLATDLRLLGGRPVKNFGSSDCHCESHLFYFDETPLKNRDFLDLLFRYRHREAFKGPEKPF